MQNPSSAARPWQVRSPGRVTTAEVRLAEGRLSYRIRLGEEVISNWAPLGIWTSVADFRSDVEFVRESTGSIQESYPMIAGKTASAVNHASEFKLVVRRHLHAMELTVRVYDDGVAYRYAMDGRGGIRVYGEASGFGLADAEAWRSWAQSVVANYEGFYPPRSGKLTGAYNLPILFHRPERAWVLLTEAAVYGDYCGSHVKSRDDGSGLLEWTLADDQANPVDAERPFVTPWRVVMLGRELSVIFQSTLIENLNPASELLDTEWIRPGRVYWSWWAGEAQDRYEVQARYVDFAAKMGWEYYLCDAGWQIDWLEQLIAYARTKNVGIFVWAHHRDVLTDDDREHNLGRWADLGVQGVKVDFFDSDSQEKIRVYDALARTTAERKLLLNYHGATKPSGERRRWPHLLTREGVYGAEYYRNHEGPTAEHNCTLPFTRNAVGPMDYTPVTYSKARHATTLTHQLALPVVFESPLQHWSEGVEGFEAYGEDAVAFFRACPTTWDESRLIEGYPGQWVVVARRKDAAWFVGAISAQTRERTVTLALTFLPRRPHQALVYQDGPEGDRTVCTRDTVTPDTVLRLVLPPRGGAVVMIEPAHT